jgi:hypothetical protein
MTAPARLAKLDRLIASGVITNKGRDQHREEIIWQL